MPRIVSRWSQPLTSIFTYIEVRCDRKETEGMLIGFLPNGTRVIVARWSRYGTPLPAVDEIQDLLTLRSRLKLGGDGILIGGTGMLIAWILHTVLLNHFGITLSESMGALITILTLAVGAAVAISIWKFVLFLIKKTFIANHPNLVHAI